MKISYRILPSPSGIGKWVDGTCDDLHFQAQVFSVGSKYGLKKSAVSRIWIKRGNKVVYNYDRGIDIRSRDPEVQRLKNYILAHAKTMYRRRR